MTTYGSGLKIKDVKKRFLNVNIESLKKQAMDEATQPFDGVTVALFSHSVSLMPHPNDNETVTVTVSVMAFGYE
jgi:hypothetical protein